MPLLCYDCEQFVIKKVMVLQAEERLLSTMNWGIMFDDEEEVYVENTSILLHRHLSEELHQNHEAHEASPLSRGWSTSC